MGADGRWVGTLPFPGCCQSMGPALSGLFRSCGHTQWGGQGCPLSLLCSFAPAQPPVPQKAPSPLPFLPAGSNLLRLPLPQAPTRHSSGLSFLLHGLPCTAGLTGLALCPSSPQGPPGLSPADSLLTTSGKTGLFKSGAHRTPERALKATEDAQTFSKLASKCFHHKCKQLQRVSFPSTPNQRFK